MLSESAFVIFDLQHKLFGKKAFRISSILHSTERRYHLSLVTLYLLDTFGLSLAI